MLPICKPTKINARTRSGEPWRERVYCRANGEEDHRLEMSARSATQRSTDPVRRVRCSQGDRVSTVTVSRMPLKNIVRALALMFATVLSAAAGDPPTLGTTELHAAAGASGVVEVEVLLKAGADVNAKDKDGDTPLHAAAGDNSSPAVLEVLLKAGADVNAKDADGNTPLHGAAFNNSSPEVLEVLLKAGADVNAKDTIGRTPLHAAAFNNPSPAVLELLLKAGADPRALDTEGKTPHAVAKPENRDILWKAMMDKPLK